MNTNRLVTEKAIRRIGVQFIFLRRSKIFNTKKEKNPRVDATNFRPQLVPNSKKVYPVPREPAIALIIKMILIGVDLFP